jgi:hypothetical protein
MLGSRLANADQWRRKHGANDFLPRRDPSRPGPKRRTSDAELICLAIAFCLAPANVSGARGRRRAARGNQPRRLHRDRRQGFSGAESRGLVRPSAAPTETRPPRWARQSGATREAAEVPRRILVRLLLALTRTETRRQEGVALRPRRRQGGYGSCPIRKPRGRPAVQG